MKLAAVINLKDIEGLNQSATVSGNVLGYQTAASQVIMDVFSNYVLTVAVFLVLAFGIYGGILYITSYGNEEKATKGKNTILWAIIGALVVGIAFVAVRYFATEVMGTNPTAIPQELK